jgi:TonB family protein
MSKIVAQSIFSLKTADRRSWQSYATSSAIHVVVIGALFLVTFPAVKQMAEPERQVTLVDPVLPVYKVKVVEPPVVRRKIILEQATKAVLPPRKFVPPVVKTPQVKTVQIAKAPEIQAPPALQHAPEIKMEAPAPPKPIVTTGVFQTQEVAKGPKVPNQVKTGGFGDPNGVHPSDNSRASQLTMAQVGSFDMPNGGGQGGGGGRAQSGGVRSSGFGSVGDPNGVPGGTGLHGSVRTGAFGDSTAAPHPAQSFQPQNNAPTTTPVEILFKPKPAYTAEAKQMGLEGQVSLDVVFTANGSVKVVRVLRGLGHGLDEAAQQAAAQVRFRPATRGGVPVDSNATIYITFQIT